MTGKSWGLDIRVWDVGLGTAIWADAASRDVMIDMGATDFYPFKHLDSYGQVNEVDLMIVTHPHQDHIRDVVHYDEVGFNISHLLRNSDHDEILEERVQEEDDESYLEIAKSYQNFVSRYQGEGSIDPTSEEFARGATFTCYFLNASEAPDGERYKRMNNMSVITVVERYGFKFVSTGDVMDDGLETIVENHPDIMDAVEDAHVLMAPHHGRNSGYLYEFVDHVNPTVAFISDKTDNGNNATAYSNLPEGQKAKNEITGEFTDEERKSLTTRNDGRLRVRANTATDWEISFRRQYAEERASRSTASNYHGRAD